MMRGSETTLKLKELSCSFCGPWQCGSGQLCKESLGGLLWSKEGTHLDMFCVWMMEQGLAPWFTPEWKWGVNEMVTNAVQTIQHPTPGNCCLKPQMIIFTDKKQSGEVFVWQDCISPAPYVQALAPSFRHKRCPDVQSKGWSNVLVPMHCINAEFCN